MMKKFINIIKFVCFSSLLVFMSCSSEEEGIPILTVKSTTTIANVKITNSSIEIGGIISTEQCREIMGCVKILARGVAYGISPKPKISDTKTTEISNEFSSTINGLNSNTTYYFRVYATNSLGTVYSEEQSFTTTGTSPINSFITITTTQITAITKTTAISGGNITKNDGSTIAVSGIVWSTKQNPTTADNKTTDGKTIGSFTSNLTGLTANTKYYVRAYATNSEGTAYGDDQSFTTTTGGTTTTTLQFVNKTSWKRYIRIRKQSDKDYKSDNTITVDKGKASYFYNLDEGIYIYQSIHCGNCFSSTGSFYFSTGQVKIINNTITTVNITN